MKLELEGRFGNGIQKSKDEWLLERGYDSVNVKDESLVSDFLVKERFRNVQSCVVLDTKLTKGCNEMHQI